MNDNDLQQLFARLERSERSRGAWRALACVLGLVLLLLGSLGVVATLDAWLRHLARAPRLGVTTVAATRAATGRGGGVTTMRGPAERPKRMPKAEDP